MQVPFVLIVGEKELGLEDVKIDEFRFIRAQMGRTELIEIGFGLALFPDVNELTPIGGNFQSQSSFWASKYRWGFRRYLW